MASDIKIRVKKFNTWFVAVVTYRGEKFAKSYDAKPTEEQVRGDFESDGMSFASLT